MSNQQQEEQQQQQQHDQKQGQQELQFQFHTFGCKVNTYDTGLLEKSLFSTKGTSRGTCVHVLNTCAVTAEATKEALKLTRKLKAQDPFSIIIVTGCGAQVDTEAFASLSSVDLVVANSHKGLLAELVQQYFKGQLKDKIFKSNIFRKEDLEPGGGIESSHTRAFVKIQDGCNSFCSYCVIPFARGKSRSLSISEVLKGVQELEAQGIGEVVLTGIHIGDYEDIIFGNKKGLEDLVEVLLKKTNKLRFRLTSLEPPELNSRLFDLFQEDRLCSHFHMSIQSASSKILKDMRRKYEQKDVIEALNCIEKKVPGAFVGMDLIVGFPTENQNDFHETFEVLRETPWTKLHVFPYSERPGTRALALQAEGLPLFERKKRSHKLRDLSFSRFQQKALDQVGTLKKVLALKSSFGKANENQILHEGLSRDYWSLKINNPTSWMRGFEYEVKVTEFCPPSKEYKEGVLKGERI